MPNLQAKRQEKMILKKQECVFSVMYAVCEIIN